jgi:hypothetical protein
MSYLPGGVSIVVATVNVVDTDPELDTTKANGSNVPFGPFTTSALAPVDRVTVPEKFFRLVTVIVEVADEPTPILRLDVELIMRMFGPKSTFTGTLIECMSPLLDFATTVTVYCPSAFASGRNATKGDTPDTGTETELGETLTLTS